MTHSPFEFKKNDEIIIQGNPADRITARRFQLENAILKNISREEFFEELLLNPVYCDIYSMTKEKAPIHGPFRIERIRTDNFKAIEPVELRERVEGVFSQSDNSYYQGLDKKDMDKLFRRLQSDGMQCFELEMDLESQALREDHIIAPFVKFHEFVILQPHENAMWLVQVAED